MGKRRRARLETGRGRGTVHAKPPRRRNRTSAGPKPGTVRVITYTPDGGEREETGRNPLRGRPPAG